MSNTDHELPKQENTNSEKKTFANALDSKRVWDKAGTGFSMPYQKPSQNIRSWKHEDLLRESNKRLGIESTSSETSTSDDKSIEITFIKKIK